MIKDGKPSVAHINVMGGVDRPTRLRKILKHASEMVRPWDVIAVNDPPSRIPFMSTRYNLWYGSKLVSEENNPMLPVSVDRRQKRKSANQPPADVPTNSPDMKVAFYVHPSISANDWYHETPGRIATLHLTTPGGDIHITNVYNHMNTASIKAIGRSLEKRGYDILVGDMNLHHPLWSGSHREPRKAMLQAKSLVSCMKTEGVNMKLLTPPETPTFKKSGDGASSTSTIDLAFVGKEIVNRDPSYRATNFFGSDHFLVEIELSIDVERITRTIHQTRNVDKAALREAVKALLHTNLGPPDHLGTDRPLKSPKEIEDFTEGLQQCLHDPYYEAVDTIVVSPTRHKVELYKQRERWARAEYDRNPNSASLKMGWEDAARLRALVDRRHQREMWQRRVATIKRPMRTIYSLAKGVSRRLRPKTLLSSQFGAENISRDKPVHSTTPSLQHSAETSPTVDPYEVKFILAGLRTAGAMGPDGTPNFVLKVCRGQGTQAGGDPFWEMIIEPYLAHMFEACLRLGYHPRIWKHSITIVLQKPNKPATDPRAWRPIALLPCLGKVYEKLVANLLKMQAIKQMLIPHNQFGFVGKSTVLALETIVNEVYRAWSRNADGKKGCYVTIMSLDIRGAFDNVKIEVLVQTLRDKKIPEWLVRAIEAFLQSRSTTVRIPGNESEKYYINIGIPQGSPLSPILFLLFAAPLLEAFDGKIFEGEFQIAAFVDDMYIICSSATYEKNCRILKAMFSYLLTAAGPLGVRLEGSKNQVMHMRDPRRPKQPICDSLPDIEGMTKGALVTLMRILGVFVDPALCWGGHMEAICTKAEKAMWRIRVLCRATHGLTFEQARRLYLTTVRTTITYCAAVFYMRLQEDQGCRPVSIQEAKYKMPKGSLFASKFLARLRSLQYQCLRTVSSAFTGTSNILLLNELNVEDIGICLHRLAVTHRAASIDSPEGKAIEYRRQGLEWRADKGKYDLERHPYETLFIEAKDVRDLAYAKYTPTGPYSEDHKLFNWSSNRVDRLHAIKKEMKELSNQQMRAMWEDYRIKRKNRGKKDTAATIAEWGPGRLALYNGLSHAPLRSCYSTAELTTRQ
ncbi:RNA-directed DNA polymerase from mobile element jockey [Apiospora arundinis]